MSNGFAKSEDWFAAWIFHVFIIQPKHFDYIHKYFSKIMVFNECILLHFMCAPYLTNSLLLDFSFYPVMIKIIKFQILLYF